MSRQLEGIIPALVTPFGPDGELATGAVGPLVDALLADGVSGFYVCGSTGECFLMDLEERKRMLEAVMEAVRGRGAVVAHVGAMATHHAVSLARHAAALGVDAVSAVPPFYYRYRIEQIVGYYRDIMRAASVPLLVYNIPGLSGVSVGADNLAEILGDPRCAGIKFTSSDFYQMERIRTRFPGLAVLSGFDEMCLAGLATGAKGAIGSTYNVMAKLFVRIYRLVGEGRLAEARPLQAAANDLIAVILEAGVNPGVKALLRHRGFAVGHCRKPAADPPPETERRLVEAMGRVEAI